jgi:8-oxo-dGTP diphosphatase
MAPAHRFNGIDIGAYAATRSLTHSTAAPAAHAAPGTTVVRALARRGEHVLMLRRALGDSFGGCWEIPGGKVDVHAGVRDRPLDALAREFREETGLGLLGTPELIATARRVSPKGTRVFELTFLAEVCAGEPTLSAEHDAASFTAADDAPGELTHAGSDALAALRAALRSNGAQKSVSLQTRLDSFV